jgi:eukaryotic-like serine/threonine-protein kinase
VLFEMLAGEPPFTGPTVQAILAKHFSAAVPSVRTTREGVPELIDRAIARALAKTPADRFPTAAEFARALSPGHHAVEEPATLRTGSPAPAPKRGAPAMRAQRLGFALLAALLVVALGWALLRRQATPTRPVSSTRLAVFPFSTSGSSRIAYLSEGMVDLLSRNLNGAGELRTIDPGTVLTATSNAGTRPSDVEKGRTLARQLGAGLYVLGSLHEIGGRLRIQAELYSDADTAGGSLARAAAEGDTTQLFQMVDRLSASLLTGRGRGLSSRLMHSASLTTHSLEALKAYLIGEQNLRGGDGKFDSAIAGFQRAVAEDSTFALAYYRLGVAGGWADRPAISGPAITRALALADRLEGRDRRLLSAFAAYQRGAADEAEQEYRAILQDYPDDLEAEFQLADLLTHYNPLRARPVNEATEPFDHVLAQDPGFLCPI